MRHCDDGALRAYVDGALGSRVRARLERHLARCASCRTQLAAVGADAAWAGARLRDYAEASALGEIDAEAAFRRLTAVWGGGTHRPRLAEGRHRPVFRLSRLRWAGAAVAAGVVLAGSLALTPVRAAAGSLLQLFRVQQVHVIDVSDADAAQIRDILQSQVPTTVDLRNLVRVRVTPSPAPRSVTLQEAAQLLPFRPKVPEPAPAGYALADVRVQPEFTVEINHLNVARINALLASVGSAEKLPGDWAGADITLLVPASVALTYRGPADQPPVRILEGGNPSLTVYPSSLDVAHVRNILLDLPFLPDDLRAQLRAVSDWQHTALIPQVSGLSRAVSVDGTQGLLVTTGEPAGDTALVWLNGDVVYAVQGLLTVAQAQAIAASLK